MAIKKFGPVEGRAKIRTCQKPPKKKHGIPTGNALLWNAAGVSAFILFPSLQRIPCHSSSVPGRIRFVF